VVEELVAWTLEHNDGARSVNAVVGETNDGWLNDGRGRHVRCEHLRAAIAAATDGDVEEGAVGAGTGTRCFGYKGGIGTSSRRVGDLTIGVLVQSNFGGDPILCGVPVPRGALTGADERRDAGERRREEPAREDGSCMIVIATDAPLDARNLERLARRAFAGMARTGASFSNGSGDYAIAFSTAASQRIRADDPDGVTTGGPVLRNDAMSPLFGAVAEATEEAIWNSLFCARTVHGRDGHVAEAFPAATAARLARR
jgi:D-aminopeptidase